MSLLFLFVQLEFTHALGPHAGRYVVEPSVLRNGAASPDASPRPKSSTDERNVQVAGVSRGVGESDVLVMSVVGAPSAKAKLLRRARKLEGADEDVREVPLTLATFVKGTEPFQRKNEAQERLEKLRFSDEEQQRLVTDGLHALNIAIRGYRAGTPDPYAMEVTRRDTRRIRIGYGDTEDVQKGAWREAIELPPAIYAKPKRTERLRPTEAVAAALVGKSEVLEAEELLMRALVDLDQGRTRGAAYQVVASLRLLPSELRAHAGADAFDFDSLGDQAPIAQDLANEATDKPLDAGQVEQLEKIVDEVAGLLDTWRYRQVEE